ncbi:MAG TPA: ABC transporter permease [Feifaniaceae bacterium]|nr:ABC transporter permease [Feifaniaceae bacterium]
MTTISITSILARMFASATPIALAGIGGLFGERSGISNIGLEGTMLFSALAAAIGSYYANSPWVGLACGAACGILISLLHAFLCITVRVDQIVIGLVINIFAANASVYLLSVLFQNKGASPAITKLPYVSIPFLRDIPGMSELFSNISLLTVLVIVIMLIAQYLLYQTRFGLHVMAAGQNEKAAFVMGVKVKRTQYLAVMIGGLCCGLAGSYLSISYLNMFVKNMVSGRGFIAIAAILIGRYSPMGVLLASLFFGLADASQMALQGTVSIPNELVQSIPYVLTILVVTINEWRTRKRKLSPV